MLRSRGRQAARSRELAADRRARAVELRAAGWSHYDISAVLGYASPQESARVLWRWRRRVQRMGLLELSAYCG